MVECKNYSAAVDQREVDKFESDAKTSGAHLALMISIQSSIKGKRRVDVSRQEDRLLGFAVCQSESDMSGIGVMIRSMLATQCIFKSAAD